LFVGCFVHALGPTPVELSSRRELGRTRRFGSVHGARTHRRRTYHRQSASRYGSLVDTINDEIYFDPFVYALYFLDQRHQVGFRYHQSGSPLEYDLVRLIYTKKREFDVWQ
jgi:hypothetical protein